MCYGYATHTVLYPALYRVLRCAPMCCVQVLLSDFFLVECEAEFQENARQLVFSDYCR